jgi:hypothetical protein
MKPFPGRLFEATEVIDNVQNASVTAPADAGEDVDKNGPVGNLGRVTRTMTTWLAS